MYVLVKDGNIEKYPYSIAQLKLDNPNVSFPYNITDKLLAEFGVYPVVPDDYPVVDYTKTVIEETPVYDNGEWHQRYSVVDASPAEIQKRILELTELAESQRAEAYRTESDPIFFKWQRGHATQQDWLNAVEQIKLRIPDPV